MKDKPYRREPVLLRAVLLFFAMFLGGTLLGTCAQPATAQEVQPQTFPLRVDATKAENYTRLYTHCGDLTKRLAVIEPGVIQTVDFPIIDLCERGLLLIEQTQWNGSIPIHGLWRYDLQGVLGGVLLCIDGPIGTAIYTYSSEVLPISCEESL